MMSEFERPPILSAREKITLLANECLDLPVQKYVPEHEEIFQEERFNGCVAFVNFVLTGAGIPIPNFIGPDKVERPMEHVNEFFDHFGISIPYGKHQPGDLVFFSWDGVRPLHIGIVVEGNKYIHAHTKDGSVHRNNLAIHQIKTEIADPLYSTNPIGFKRPTVANVDDRWFQRTI